LATWGGADACGHLRWGRRLRPARARKKARGRVLTRRVSTIGVGRIEAVNEFGGDWQPGLQGQLEDAVWGVRAAGLPGRGSRSRVFLVHAALLGAALLGAEGVTSGAADGAPSATKRPRLERGMLSQRECERPVTRHTSGGATAGGDRVIASGPPGAETKASRGWGVVVCARVGRQGRRRFKTRRAANAGNSRNASRKWRD